MGCVLRRCFGSFLMFSCTSIPVRYRYFFPYFLIFYLSTCLIYYRMWVDRSRSYRGAQTEDINKRKRNPMTAEFLQSFGGREPAKERGRRRIGVAMAIRVGR